MQALGPSGVWPAFGRESRGIPTWKERVVADLDADDREKIPTKEFGLPGFPRKARTKEAKQSGNYPMPDKAHARNAKSRRIRSASAARPTRSSPREPSTSVCQSRVR
jgi:hypothetical protein